MTIERLHRTGGDPADRSAVDLASFVAWLATRVENEPARRRCRMVAQVYLEWSWGDGGPSSNRRARFATTAARRLELTGPQVEEALARLAEYRAIVVRTLPVDG